MYVRSPDHFNDLIGMLFRRKNLYQPLSVLVGKVGDVELSQEEIRVKLNK